MKNQYSSAYRRQKRQSQTQSMSYAKIIAILLLERFRYCKQYYLHYICKHIFPILYRIITLYDFKSKKLFKFYLNKAANDGFIKQILP